MPDQDKAHEQARDLAEQALDHYAEGDQKGGDKLAQEAVDTDRAGAEEVVHDLDEDAQATGKAG